MQTAQARYIQDVLYSLVCIFLLQPPALAIYNCLLFYLHPISSSSNVTAGGSQYVICTKYEIHKTFNQQLQPIMFSRGAWIALSKIKARQAVCD